MHTIKITPNLLFEYQYTSGKFIRLSNRFGSENRVESNRNFFCPNWNALVTTITTAVSTSFLHRGTTYPYLSLLYLFVEHRPAKTDKK